jgi:NitT/TauT family transport system substrate-binding protein
MRIHKPRRRVTTLTLAMLCSMLAALTLLVGSSAGASDRALATVNVTTLPIANGLPLDLGISKGIFEKHSIEIKKTVLQSGNDIVLALANNNGDIGYIGWVPAFIADTAGIDIVTAAASEVEGTNVADNWQDILVKGSSAIRTPQDLAGKTIAVNALKGVGEVVIRAAFKKLGISQDSIRLVPIPFPSMRTALANGQVDAIWTPEPFRTQAINQDNARVVMAPGPVVMPFLPNGMYAARKPWASANPAIYRNFRLALNESLVYAQGHPDEIRALLPAATRDVRLPVWSPILDRGKLLQLARYAREFGVIATLPDMTQLVPGTIATGVILKGEVGRTTISLKLDKQPVKTLEPGTDTFAVVDRSAKQNFHLKGPGVDRKTNLKKAGKATWTVVLRRGTYRFFSDANPKLKGSFKVG